MLTTLSISTQEIKLVAVKGKKVKCWTSRALESGIVRDGRVMDPQKLAEIIAQLFKTQKLPRHKVVVALSGLPYSYRIVDFPLLKDDQVEGAMMRALPDEFTIPLEELCLSWTRLVTRPEGADYFVLGVDRDLADSVVQTMKLAGIRDWCMDLKPLALARAAGATDAIIASLDFDHMDMVLVRHGYIRELHSAALDHEGKRLKFDRFMDIFVSEIVKILSFHHDAGEGESDTPPTELPILVTGDLIAQAASEGEIPDERQIIASMGKLTGHNVSLMELPVAGPESFNANAFAINIGLFLRTFSRKARGGAAPDRFHDVAIDILSGRYEKKPVMVPMWYTVAPVILFLVVFGAWSFNNAYAENNARVEDLEEEMVSLTAELAAREAKIERQDELQQQVTAAEANLRTLREQHESLLTGKGTNIVRIADVRAALPEDGSLTSIGITNSGVRLSGVVATPFDVIAYVKALEGLGYSRVDLHNIDNGDEGTFIFNISIITEEGG